MPLAAPGAEGGGVAGVTAARLPAGRRGRRRTRYSDQPDSLPAPQKVLRIVTSGTHFASPLVYAERIIGGTLELPDGGAFAQPRRLRRQPGRHRKAPKTRVRKGRRLFSRLRESGRSGGATGMGEGRARPAAALRGSA